MTTRYASWADVLRLLPPIGESGRPSRAAHRRLSRRARSIDRRTRCARRCSSRTSGRTSAATGAPAGCTCRARSTRACRRATRSSCGAATSTEAWTRALDAVRRASRASCFDAGRAVCDGVRGRLGSSCGSPGSAARASSSASSARGVALLDRRPTLGVADVPPLLVARGSLERAVRDGRARPASTTRSSSCPPTSAGRSSPSGISAARWTMRWTRSRRRRRLPTRPRRPSRSGARSWRACFDGATPRDAAGPARCSRSSRAFDLPRQAFEDVIDGVAMDLDTHRYETFDDLFEYCRRVASAVGLICIRSSAAASARAATTR